jgi:hypothetical protein
MNLSTLLVLIFIVAIFSAIIVTSIVNKRRGKASCSCGGGCSGCPMSGKCHQESHPANKRQP